MLLKIKAWIQARLHETSTKMGVVMGAIATAAVQANALRHPYDWMVFGTTFAMIVAKDHGSE